MDDIDRYFKLAIFVRTTFEDFVRIGTGHLQNLSGAFSGPTVQHDRLLKVADSTRLEDFKRHWQVEAFEFAKFPLPLGSGS